MHKLENPELCCPDCNYIPTFYNRYADLERHCLEHHSRELKLDKIKIPIKTRIINMVKGFFSDEIKTEIKTEKRS